MMSVETLEVLRVLGKCKVWCASTDVVGCRYPRYVQRWGLQVERNMAGTVGGLARTDRGELHEDSRLRILAK